jgi:hypothetical protein
MATERICKESGGTLVLLCTKPVTRLSAGVAVEDPEGQEVSK